MRKGSALLVVLGMIAFMVVSAVAFSAWMRYARLPSSYLRRSSASRHLAKAAIAQAIEVIDISIGNNPHPGVGNRPYANPRIGGRIENRNYWRNNCFIGTNRLLSAEDTVSTLTMEALAYIPPALINEARYFSRHSAAGAWRNLGFDSGRYAFSAIDVSDHIDINRVFADRGRSSADKGKVSLAHIFENASHTGAGNPSADKWDAFMEKFNNVERLKLGEADAHLTGSSKLPLISLADLNLALNDEGLAETLSPFCRYINSQGNTDFASENDFLSPAALMNFVTDSYFPSGASTNEEYNILRRQPFSSISANRSDRQKSVIEILEQSSTMLTRFEENVSGLDIVSLYDYLDGNNVPASLALPTTERVPMVCGLQSAISFDLQPSMTKNPDPSTLNPDAPDAPQQVIVFHECRMKLSNPLGAVGGLFTFPFQRDKDVPNQTFNVDYAVRIGLSVGNGPGLRTSGSSAYVVGDNADFERKGVENGVIKLHRTGSALSFSDVKTEAEAMKKLDATLEFNEAETWFQNNWLFRIPHLYVLSAPDPISGKRQYEDQGPSPTQNAKINSGFRPVNADGTGDGGFNPAMLRNNGSVQVLPYATIVARIQNGGKTVDLVPASFYDDRQLNGIDNDPAIANINGGNNQRPLITLKSQSASPIAFGEGTFTGGQSVNVTLKFADKESIVCPDPRWNFAPENFYATSDSLQAGDWFAQNVSGVGEQGRDGDMFMFVSNQGYLQSVSELAFLARTAVDMGGGDAMLGNSSVAFNRDYFENFPGKSDAFTTLAHGQFMWRTYRLYRQGGFGADGIYDRGIVADGSGFRINPYTSSRNIMMAAVANTPYSWWAASTNNQDKAMEECDANEFNRTYAFSEMNSSARFAWKDLRKIAANLIIDRNSADSWENHFSNLDWAGENSDFCGVDFDSTDVDALKEVDRKFLYGFWRDTFAVKQQLFLVFVRAEPLMMGGGASGQTPPQLGARAVALVWRDPTPSKEDVSGQPRPHQTRILFYRQFD